MIRIRYTYELVTPESAEHNDVEERGWYQPGGWHFAESDQEASQHAEVRAKDALHDIKQACGYIDSLTHSTDSSGLTHVTLYGYPDDDYRLEGSETRCAHFVCKPRLAVALVTRLISDNHMRAATAAQFFDECAQPHISAEVLTVTCGALTVRVFYEQNVNAYEVTGFTWDGDELDVTAPKLDRLWAVGDVRGVLAGWVTEQIWQANDASSRNPEPLTISTSVQSRRAYDRTQRL